MTKETESQCGATREQERGKSHGAYFNSFVLAIQIEEQQNLERQFSTQQSGMLAHRKL